jgi:hypothetical protein
MAELENKKMSIWYEVKDADDVDFSLDGKEIDILFKTDKQGNHYVSVPVEIIRKLLDDLHTKANNPEQIRPITGRLPQDEETAKETLPDLREDTEG